MKKFSVALIGATGLVGQKAISLLERHPRFELKEIAASDGRIGQKFSDSAKWKDEGACPESVKNLILKPLLDIQSKYVISALPAEIAKEIEPQLAAKGHIVCSNASAFRMHPQVPLMIPEINVSHFSLLDQQPWKGRIITNPNCSTVFLVGALAPLMPLGEIQHISAVTLQALSGAGYPGVSSLDLLSNIVPHIDGEEAKIQQESKKILGTDSTPKNFGLTVHVHRVPVLHGHTVALHVHFKSPVSVKDVIQSFKQAEIQKKNWIKVHSEHDRPQPRLDLHPHDMQIHVGRIKQGDHPNVVGLISMGHNLVRGAAGAALSILDSYVDHYQLKP